MRNRPYVRKLESREQALYQDKPERGPVVLLPAPEQIAVYFGVCPTVCTVKQLDSLFASARRGSITGNAGLWSSPPSCPASDEL